MHVISVLFLSMTNLFFYKTSRIYKISPSKLKQLIFKFWYSDISPLSDTPNWTVWMIPYFSFGNYLTKANNYISLVARVLSNMSLVIVFDC